MRTISSLECELLSSFIKFPSLILCYNDLEKKHLGELAFIIYTALLSQNISDGLSEYQVFLELRKRDLISSDEYQLCVDDFGIPSPAITSFSAEHAYNGIKEKWNVIHLKESLLKIVKTSTDSEEIKRLIGELRSSVDDVCENFIPINNVPDDTKERYNFKFGIENIDKHVRISGGDLIFLGARPFSGKTTLAVKFAMENTVYGKVLFYSLEMDAKRIKWKARSYGFAYKPENFLVRSASGVTIPSIARAIAKFNPTLVVIDQLNKINIASVREYDRFTMAARSLKELATETQIPIICLAQINRSSELAERPHLHQFKGSGSIEEEGDVAMLLSVDLAMKTTTVFLDKNRTKIGSVGVAHLSFDLETDRYKEMFAIDSCYGKKTNN